MAKGNHTARGQQRDKPFAAALRLEIAAAQDDNDFRSLRRVAKMLLAAASDGDVQAIKEVADRLDGKPAIEASLTVNDKFALFLPALATNEDEWIAEHGDKTLQ